MPRANSPLPFVLLSLFALLAGCENGSGPPEPPRLSLQARTQTLNSVGDTLQVHVTATGAGGEPLSTAGVVWASSNTQVAAVTGGFVNTRGVGTTTITATLRGVEARWQLEVRQVPARVRMTAPKATLSISETSQLSAVLLDSVGTTIPGGPFTWSSSLPGIATVTPTGGMVSALGSGRTQIRAASAGLAAETEIAVVFTGTDNTAPDAMKVDVSFVPSRITLSGADSVAVLTVRGEDDGYGLGLITVKVGQDVPLVTCRMDNPTSGNGQNGTWTCPIRRSQLAGAGTYRVLELVVRDFRGSGFDTYAENLEAFDRQAYLTVAP